MLKIKTKNKKETLVVLSRLSRANTFIKELVFLLSLRIFHLQCGSLSKIMKLKPVKAKQRVVLMKDNILMP